MGLGNLSLDNRDCHREKTDTDTLDGATGNEGCEIGSEYLDESTEEVNETAETDTSLSTNHVAESSRYECSYSCGCLQARNRYPSDGRIDGRCSAVRAPIVFKKAGYKDWIDQQAGHDTYRH